MWRGTSPRPRSARSPLRWRCFSQGIVPGLLTLAYFIVYQQVENYLIVPRVMRNAVDMSSLAVLLSTIIGASLAGFAGALLAIPVAAILKVVLTGVCRTYRGEELEAPEPVVGDPREGA